MSEQISSEVRNIVADVLKSHAFKRHKSAYWHRVQGDTIQAIRLDRRTVGRFPYYIETAFDFISTGGRLGQDFNLFPVGLAIDRLDGNYHEVLNALSPNVDFEDDKTRISLITQLLNDFVMNFCDKINTAKDILDLRGAYPSQNTLTILPRIEKLISRNLN